MEVSGGDPLQIATSPETPSGSPQAMPKNVSAPDPSVFRALADAMKMQSPASAPATTNFEWNSQPAFSTEDEANPWRTQGRKRQRQAPSQVSTSVSFASRPPEQATRVSATREERRTVILRPTHRIKVASLRHSPIQARIVEAAGPLSHRCRIRIQTRANLIAVDCWEPTVIPKLLEITQINFGTDETVNFRPYEPLREGSVRAVLY